MTSNPLELGASLYVPSIRSDLSAISTRERYPFLRSVIFCTEDGIAPEDLGESMDNLRRLLARLADSSRKPRFETLRRFVRVRSPEVLADLLRMKGVDRLDGFVFPKIHSGNVDDYFSLLEGAPRFQVMPTLETVEVFDPGCMRDLRDRLLEERYRTRILSMRVGGNDLLNLLGLRRPNSGTIYETPLSGTLSQLVTIWRPHGFNLTGPVCELLEDRALLSKETKQDLGIGLFGKTAIHPKQVPVIESAYRVSEEDHLLALQLLENGTPAVFRFNDAMCEPATQRRWALATVERARIYGVVESARVKARQFAGT